MYTSLKRDLARGARCLDDDDAGTGEFGRWRGHRLSGADVVERGSPLPRLLAPQASIDGLQVLRRAPVEAVAHRVRRARYHVRLQRTDVDRVLGRELASRRQCHGAL